MVGNPGRVEHALAAAWLLLCTLVMSNAAGGFFPVLLLAIGAVFLGAIWAIRLYAAIRSKRRIRLERFLIWPGVFLLACGLHFTQLPRVVRVKLSEGELLEAIEQNRMGRAGLFRVHHIEQEFDGAYVVTSDGLLGWAGFAYIPHDIPADSGRSVRHLYGHWWTFQIPD